MAQQQIQEFNEQLVGADENITIIDYIQKVAKKFYDQIEISFMQDFMEIVGKEDFCIHHEMLIKYGTLAEGTDAYNIQRLLNQYKFKINVDYKKEQGHCLKVEAIKTTRCDKITFWLTPDAFKLILMWGQNIRDYAYYYILLEKCVRHYNEYEKLKLQQKINEINKIKLLKLESGETLDNFIIVKTDEDTLHVRKLKGEEHIYKHNYVKYPYATIKGSDKNISKMMKKNRFKIENILFDKQLPSQSNFNKKVTELLKTHIVRQKVYYNKNTEKVFFGDIDDIEEEEEDEDNQYSVSITKFFSLENITESEFIDKVKMIDLSRFN